MSGQKIDIEIQKVLDAGHFIASPLALPGSDIENFMGKLNDYFLYHGNRTAKSITPEKGKVYVVQRTMDKCWYRARIQNIMQTTAGPQASVLLVDVGEQTLIPFSRVCEIPKEFNNIPFQVMECHLTGVKPLSLITSYFDLTTTKQVSDKWTEAATKFVLDLLAGCVKLQVIIQNEDDKGRYHVLLYAESQDKEVCVNDELVQREFAVFDDSQPVKDENPRKTERLRAQQEQFVRAQQEVLSAFKKSIHEHTPSHHHQEEMPQESTSTDEEAPPYHRNPLQQDARQFNPLDFLRQQVTEMRTPNDLHDLPVCYIPAGAESRSPTFLPSCQNPEKASPQEPSSNLRERDAQGNEIFSPSSDEDLGRVRFVSARIPATGSGEAYLSKDHDTAKLKSILKSSRTGSQYSSSSSDQETGRSGVMERQDQLNRHRMDTGNSSLQYPSTPGLPVFPRAPGEFSHDNTEMRQSLPLQYPDQRISNISSREEFGQAVKAIPPSGTVKNLSPTVQEGFPYTTPEVGQSLPWQYPDQRISNVSPRQEFGHTVNKAMPPSGTFPNISPRAQEEFPHTTPKVGQSLPVHYPAENVHISPRDEFGRATNKSMPPSGTLPRLSPRVQEGLAYGSTDMDDTLPKQYPREWGTDTAGSWTSTMMDHQLLSSQGSTSARIPNISPRAREECLQSFPSQGSTARIPNISSRTREESTPRLSEAAPPVSYQMPSQVLPQASSRPLEEIFNHTNAKPSSLLPSEMPSQSNSKPTSRLPSDIVSQPSTSCDSESSLVDGVLIHGDGIPRPFTAIANCPLYEYGSRLDIQTPTPLQRHMWPALLRGRDVAGVAHKNAGRKMAYLLPIVDQVLDHAAYSELPLTNGPLALILCDSWSNAIDVYQECNKILGPRRTARVHVIFGGGAEEEQVVPLINGCEILVATVPCFMRMLTRSYTTMDRLCHIVFDNADFLVEDFTAELKQIMRVYGRLLVSQPGRVAPRQAVIMSSFWTVGVASLVRAYLGNPLIIMDDKVEATLYSGVQQAVELCSYNKRLTNLLGFLENADRTHEIVIFTNTAQEAENLGEALKTNSYFVLVAHEFINPQQLADTRRQWYSPHSTDLMPILVMTDGVLLSSQLTIQNASMVIHYDLPLAKNKEKFGERLFAMSRTFTATKNHGCLSVLFVTEACMRQSTVAHQLVQRTAEHTPAEDTSSDAGAARPWKIISSSLEKLAKEARVAKEREKFNYELCDFLMAFGSCRTFSDTRFKCNMRHVVLKDEDFPCLPTSGTVKVLVLHVMNATCLWVRILDHKPPKGGTSTPYHVTSSTQFLQMTVEMGMWYANEKNRKRIDMPSISDLYALEQDGSYHRVKVCDVFRNLPQSGLPLEAQVHFVDKGTYQNAKVSSLLCLPAQFRDLPFQAVQVFVCRVKPQYKSLQWTPRANVFVKNLVEGRELEGRVVLSLSNTMWLDPLFERRVLKSIKVTTNINNIRMELLKNGLATENKHHIKELRKLCEDEIDLSLFDGKNADGGSYDTSISLETVALKEDDYQDVFVSAVENPALFFVQLAVNDPSLEELERAIEEGINCVSYEDDDEIAIGSLCMACFTQDDKWYRARILGTRPDNEYDVFFVDFGDREWVTRNRLRPAWPDVLAIPLQAVECSLVNVIPLENDWTTSDGDELWDMCSLANGDKKLLVAKVRSKVASLMSGCHRFVVELFDTSTSIDVVISEELVANGHAQTSPEGIQTLFPEAAVQLGQREYKYEHEKIPDMCRDILQSRDPSQRLSIAKSLQTIVMGSPSAKDAIREGGGVRSLCRLLALTRAPAVQEHLLVSLDCLSFQNNSNCDEARRAGGLKTLCYLMEKSRNISVKSHVAWTLKNLAATETNQDTIRDLDGIKALCNELKSTTEDKLQEHIAWALEVLCMDNSKNCDAVNEHGGLKTLCGLVSHTTQENVLERTTRALGALATTPSNRNLIRQHGGLQGICRRIQDNPDETYLRTATGTLKILVSNNQHNKDVLRDMGMIHTLQKLTRSTQISSITRRLCSDLLQRLLGWAAAEFDVRSSPEKTATAPHHPSPQVENGTIETRTALTRPELNNGVHNDLDDMPPLEGTDEEDEKEQVQPVKAEKIKSTRAKVSTMKKSQKPFMPLPLNKVIEDTRFIDENDNKRYNPFTFWSQSKDLVRVAIRLRGVTKHQTEVQEKKIVFSTRMQGKNYALDLELFDCVITEESKVEVKGDEVLILLKKSKVISWPRLLKTKDKFAFLKIDLDRWEWSSSEDEDETPTNNPKPESPKPRSDDDNSRKQAIVPEMDTSESSSSETDDEEMDYRDFLSFD